MNAAEELSGAGQEPSASGALQLLAQRTMSTFAVPPDEEQLVLPLTEDIAKVANPLAEIATAFRTNIAGLISTVSVPYTLASRSANDRHWQNIYTAARIRSLKLDQDLNESKESLEARREREAVARARSEMDKHVASPEGREALVRDTLLFLDNLRSDAAVIRAANELILQGVVLCWGAFEVFARDCFIAHLNAKPSRTLDLLADSVAKRRFELSKVSVETLASHNFDLSRRMGTLLAQQQDLSDVTSVKCVYQALFPENTNLSEALNDSDLRFLSLRRNLIVHQCGVIDEMYSASTKCCEPVGSRLSLSPHNLEAHLGTAVKVAAIILGAVSSAS